MIRPHQIRSEIARLLEVLRRTPPERVLEIGTADGGTLYLLARTAAPSAQIISVDLPGGLFGDGVAYPKWRAPLYRNFRRPEQSIRLLRGDSHEAATVERVREELAGRQLDFLFIDGDHSYEGVKSDFELYEPFVRPGGITAFHDIVEATTPEAIARRCLAGGDVPRFWQEIRATRMTEEFIQDGRQGWAGIGIVRKT
ncbi:MAG: class I SAM-dependent methyltransferase [Solirubrobacterales bacterium]